MIFREHVLKTKYLTSVLLGQSLVITMSHFSSGLVFATSEERNERLLGNLIRAIQSGFVKANRTPRVQ